MKAQLLVVLLLMSHAVFAEEDMPKQPIKIGATLPPVSLGGDAGELQFRNLEVEYVPWSSESLRGRVHLLYIVAARMGIDKINQPLLDALQAEGGVEAFPEDQVKVISMINIDDVFPMGGAFARKAFEDASRAPENRHALFVLDDNSVAQKAWGLKRKGVAVIVLDRSGVVRRFKDGALSKEEIAGYVHLLKTLRDGGDGNYE